MLCTVGRHSENLRLATLKSQVSEPSLNRYDRWDSFIRNGNAGCRLSVLITFQRLRNRGVCYGVAIRSIRVKQSLRGGHQTSREYQRGFVFIFEVFAQSGVYILGVKPLENIEKEVLFFGVAHAVEDFVGVHRQIVVYCTHNLNLFRCKVARRPKPQALIFYSYQSQERRAVCVIRLRCSRALSCRRRTASQK